MDIFTEKYCRFCLKAASRRVKLLKIDEPTEESFYELTQIKVKIHKFNYFETFHEKKKLIFSFQNIQFTRIYPIQYALSA